MSGDHASPNPSLILLMAMAFQSNFKAMLDLFGTLAMQLTETTYYNSQTWLLSLHQPLFLQPPLFSLFTLQFLQELQRMQMASKRCFTHHQKRVGLKQGKAVKARKMARNQAKASGLILRLQCSSKSGRKG